MKPAPSGMSVRARALASRAPPARTMRARLAGAIVHGGPWPQRAVPEKREGGGGGGGPRVGGGGGPPWQPQGGGGGGWGRGPGRGALGRLREGGSRAGDVPGAPGGGGPGGAGAPRPADRLLQRSRGGVER